MIYLERVEFVDNGYHKEAIIDNLPTPKIVKEGEKAKVGKIDYHIGIIRDGYYLRKLY
jgi:hypothetical protein